MTKSKKLWTREELILTFFLYLKLPFGQMHRNNPEVKELAQIIGRSVNAVALRLANFAACDPFLKKRGIRGMPGGLKQCQPIWDEFYNDKETLLYESECALSTLKNCSSNSFIDFSANIELDILGIDKQRVKKERINQFLFRKMVLANYNYKCAISGMDIPELL